MENELPKHSICPFCARLFTLIYIKKVPFYVHTKEENDYCLSTQPPHMPVPIGDNQQFKERCMVALARLNKKRERFGVPINEDGEPKIFGE